MSNGSSKRTRSDRVAAIRLPPGKIRQALAQLRRNDVLIRLGLYLAAAVSLWTIAAPWHPPLQFQVGDVPQRSVAARVWFDRDRVPLVYRHDPRHLDDLISDLKVAVGKVQVCPNYDVAEGNEFKQLWGPFIDHKFSGRQSSEKEREFASFRGGVPNNFEEVIKAVSEPFRTQGLLDTLHEGGNRTEIMVYPIGQPSEKTKVRVADVYIDYVGAPVANKLKTRLEQNPLTKQIAPFIYAWMRHRLASAPTLTLDQDESAKLQQQAASHVPEQWRDIEPGTVLAAAGKPLTNETLDLLKLEHELWLNAPGRFSRRVYRSLAMLAFVLGLVIPGAVYLHYRAPSLQQDTLRLALVLFMLVATAALARWLPFEPSRWEMVLFLLFGMTMAIAYQRELALLFSAALIGEFTLATGRGVGEFFLVLGVVSTAVVLLTNIRSRMKLIQICTIASGTAYVLTLVFGILDGRTPNAFLLDEALQMAFWTLATGFLITGLLPFIERLFGVLTDVKLLELSDVSHPLLQELVRRAPGTYNHSINVGAMAEAAADAISARGLLVRVGAYFHDIGKMLKPAYFVENQGQDNRHEALAPAMSTLIIIAHIKDGADLARQHHLPQAFVDFIEQHHGTTLVEFFYQRAALERDSNPDAAAVEEGAFRYPGPKPQTKEAAVLMLADAVESASRTLADPAPARIESLVEEIVMKRLMDDQFDECAINLKELRIVQDSLIKSLIAVYHGRVKYPTQRTA